MLTFANPLAGFCLPSTICQGHTRELYLNYTRFLRTETQTLCMGRHSPVCSCGRMGVAQGGRTWSGWSGWSPRPLHPPACAQSASTRVLAVRTVLGAQPPPCNPPAQLGHHPWWAVVQPLSPSHRAPFLALGSLPCYPCLLRTPALCYPVSPVPEEDNRGTERCQLVSRWMFKE